MTELDETSSKSQQKRHYWSQDQIYFMESRSKVKLTLAKKNFLTF